MWRTNRYGIAVLPRQTGKDVAASMEQCDARLKTSKTTGVYISLNNPMVRDILWDKTYIDPVSQQFIRGLQDNVPSSYVDWKNTIMEGRFHNDSRLKLQGYFQSGQDTSGVGTSYQDYTITELSLFQREDPIPRLRPIIEGEHETKRLMVVSTPRGKRANPLWQLMEEVKGRKDAQVIIRTIDDLNEIMRREGLQPVLTEERLEEIRDGYMRRFGNARMFEQEYYCSFEEMDATAVYGEAYMRLLAEGRADSFNLDPGHPVYVQFDIGASGLHSDATAWIAFQWYNDKIFVIDCGEGHGRALPEYMDILQQRPWYPKLAQIILPWDGDFHEKAVNTTPADMMRKRFPNVAVLAKSNKVYKISGSRSGDYNLVTDIQQTRMALYKMYINGADCQRLLECLESYKYAFNSGLGVYSDKPVHDQYSHMCDALRYVVQATKELDFFQGHLLDDGKVMESQNYLEDWAGVWRK